MSFLRLENLYRFGMDVATGSLLLVAAFARWTYFTHEHRVPEAERHPVNACTYCHAPPGAGTNGQANASWSTTRSEIDLRQWNRSDFARLVRSGAVSDGRRSHRLMPVTQYASLSDDEIDQIWRYFVRR